MTGADGNHVDLPGLDRVDGSLGPGPGLLVHRVIDAAAESYLDLVDALYVEIDRLEDELDDLPASTLRQRLSSLRHEMLHARRNASATRAAVRRVVDGRLDLGTEDALFPRDVERAFADTYDTLVRAIEELDVARDLLSSLRDYLQSKVAEGQSELRPVLSRLADAQANGAIDEATRGHIRNVELYLARVLEEMMQGRTQSTNEIRSEIKLLARTIAAIAEDQPR